MYTRYLGTLVLFQYEMDVDKIVHDHADNVMYDVQGTQPHFCVRASTAAVKIYRILREVTAAV